MKKCPNCGYCEPPPYPREVGEKLRSMRESLGLSLAQLGKLSNQNPSMIGMIERGERKARRRVVDPAIAVMRERAASTRNAVEEYDKTPKD